MSRKLPTTEREIYKHIKSYCELNKYFYIKIPDSIAGSGKKRFIPKKFCDVIILSDKIFFIEVIYLRSKYLHTSNKYYNQARDFIIANAITKNNADYCFLVYCKPLNNYYIIRPKIYKRLHELSNNNSYSLEPMAQTNLIQKLNLVNYLPDLIL